MDRMVYLGIDGGGTGSRALLADAELNPLAELQGGPLNPYAMSALEVERNLRDLIARTLDGAGLQPAAVRGVGAGVAGVRTAEEGEPVRALLSQLLPDAGRVRVTHDIEIALRGGIPGGEGIVIVAGTGSAAYGGWGGRAVHVGGWGVVMGDDGSGYWLGTQALRAVAQALDGRGEQTSLQMAVFDRLSLTAPRDLVAWSLTASKAEIAGLAETVLGQHRLGDRVAGKILDSGAAEIARTAVAAVRQLDAEGVRIVLTGGLMAPEGDYFRACRRWIGWELPSTAVTPPARSAVWGAVEMAMSDT